MNDTTTTPPRTGPDPDPDPGPPRRLRRHPDDRVVAGVAGGLGHYFGVDPIVFRLGFVVFAVLGGGGLLLYALAWIVIPQGEDAELAPRWSGGDLASWIGLALVVVALLMLGGMAFTWRPGIVAALILLAGGVLLFQHSAQSGDSPPASPRPDGGARTEPATPPADTSGSTGPALPPAPGDSRAWWRDAREAVRRPAAKERPKSRLGKLTFAMLFLALGTLGVLDAAGVLRPDAGDYTALALGVVGAGLLAGAWWGRSRWLIAVGVLLLPVTVIASLASSGSVMAGGMGEIVERPGSLAEVARHYRLGTGSLVLDLSALTLAPGQVVAIGASVGMGQLEVIVPHGPTVRATGSAELGQVSLFRRAENGVDPRQTVTDPGNPLAGGIVLELDVGMGRIEVRRAGTEAPRLQVLRPPLLHPEVW